MEKGVIFYHFLIPRRHKQLKSLLVENKSIIYIPCIVNTMAADGLVMHKSKASAAMLLD